MSFWQSSRFSLPRFCFSGSGDRQHAGAKRGHQIMNPTTTSVVFARTKASARKSGCCLLFSLTLLLFYQRFTATLQAEEPESPVVMDPVVEQCLVDMTSASFSLRQKAVQTLTTASAEQLKSVAMAVESHPDNEVIWRLIEILELRYDGGTADSPEASIASNALEKAATSERWFVAEAALDVLQRHWQRRVEIAVTELVKIGVPLKPTDPTDLWKREENPDVMLGGRGAASSQHLKIYVDSVWPADPRAFELLTRLEELRGRATLRQPSGVSVYLLDGHTLSIEQVAILKGIFGALGVAERGQVCLGIMPNPGFGGEVGVLVGKIEKGSSADAADIREDDLIMAMNGEKLTDFDQLVTRLRKYKVGDKVTLTVLSHRLPGQRGVRDVEVTLKGWY